MSRNSIREFDDQTAATQQMIELRRQLQQFKSGVQSPTIQKTSLSSASAFLFSSWFDAGAIFPQVILKATLTPPSAEQILFAVPEVIFGVVGQPNNIGVFPEGSYFAHSANTSNTPSFLAPSWWLDWNDTNDSNLVAYIMFRLDAAMWGLHSGLLPPWDGTHLNVGVRWRFMTRGAST